MKPNATKTSRAGYHTFKGGAGSFEVFWDDADQMNGSEPRNYDGDGEPVRPGWYWWACFPGCLPDGEPSGPFATSAAAYRDALDY